MKWGHQPAPATQHFRLVELSPKRVLVQFTDAKGQDQGEPVPMTHDEYKAFCAKVKREAGR